MRLSRFLLFSIAFFSLSSCFKEEPLNAECDIEAAWVHVDKPEDVFFNNTDTLVDVMSAENTIVFTKKPDADVTAMAPWFRLTPGARITPENGSEHDFSNEQAGHTPSPRKTVRGRGHTVSCSHRLRSC